MKTYKAHMVIWAQLGEGFRTVCGIDDGSSSQFQDKAELCDFGDERGTTCKNCLQRFNKMLTNHDIEVMNLRSEKRAETFWQGAG